MDRNQIRKEVDRYLEALEIVEQFEGRFTDVDAKSAKRESEAPAISAPKPETQTVDERLRGKNMQETVFNAVQEIPVGEEFEPSWAVDILTAQAPIAVGFYEIDEKKARDTLSRLIKDPERGIERAKPGIRGPHGRPPTFRRVDPGSEKRAAAHLVTNLDLEEPPEDDSEPGKGRGVSLKPSGFAREKYQP